MSVLIIFSFTTPAFSQKSVNFYITLEGERVDCHGDIRMDASRLYYENAEGKNKSEKQKSIKLMVVFNRVFLNLPINKNLMRLQEVYAYSSEYIITGYWQTSTYLYVWDSKFNPVVGKIFFNPSGKREKNQKKFDEEIKKYLADCEKVINRFSSNIQSFTKINEGVSYYNCDEAESPIDAFMKLNQ